MTNTADGCGSFPIEYAKYPNTVIPTSSYTKYIYGLTGSGYIYVVKDYVAVAHSWKEEGKSLKEKREDQKKELLNFVNKRPRRR